MNRFFSKLDLRDIKIDPEGSRFPPDADEAAVELQADVQPEPVTQAGNGHLETATTPEVTFEPGMWESSTIVADSPEPQVPTQPIIQSDVVLQDAAVTGQPTYSIEGVIVGSDGEVLKVSARSRPSAVAGAIAGVVREAGRAEVQAIGAGATNQAIKAVAIAREYLRETGIDAVCVPAFIDVTIENEDRTAIRLVIEPR